MGRGREEGRRKGKRKGKGREGRGGGERPYTPPVANSWLRHCMISWSFLVQLGIWASRYILKLKHISQYKFSLNFSSMTAEDYDYKLKSSQQVETYLNQCLVICSTSPGKSVVMYQTNHSCQTSKIWDNPNLPFFCQASLTPPMLATRPIE